MSGNKKENSTTSQKHRNFVSEPMGNRSVRDVPGIGPVQGRRLEDKGVPRADQMLGQYLVSGRDQGQFQGYLKNTTGANAKQQSDAYNGMREWTNNNM
ncbi:hypothetical protein J4Q44_G00130280 [Coregonus suidteri]|uniref:Barrier-to-autointegration factor 1 n=1 Tax=Coregonus suidteri TaxID=861788 RepID=A0AAN8R0A4_9TELE